MRFNPNPFLPRIIDLMLKISDAGHTLLMAILACILFLCIFSIAFLSLRKWEVNKWPILAFFSNGWFVLSLQLGELGYGVCPPNLVLSSLSVQLLFFPALYFYVKRLVRAEEPLSKGWILHFLPFLLFFGWLLTTDAPSLSAFSSISIPRPVLVMLIVSVFLSLFYNYLIYAN